MIVLNHFPEEEPRFPNPATLRKYGLGIVSWLDMLKGQGGVCAICKKVPFSGRWVIDHEHVPGYKKLPAGERRKYVRGILCHWCNSHVLSRFTTLDKLRMAVIYFESYQNRNKREV